MKNQLKLVAGMVVLALAGCGGGGSTTTAPGSGSSTTTPPVTSTPSPVLASTQQASVPTPTYTAGSEELAMFNLINDFRTNAGLGKLAQSAAMDKADQNHLKYLLTNSDINFSAVDPKTGRPFFHLEDSTRPNFTGITEIDRANFAGYGGVYVGETGSYGGGNGAAKAMSALIATVYHRAGMLFQTPSDIGIAVGNDVFQTTVVTFGYKSTPLTVAADFLGTYPGMGQANVPLSAGVETPNALPDVPYADFPTKTSYPINVFAKEFTTLTVNSFTVTEAGQSAPLEVRLMTKDTDPNKYLMSNVAFIIGKAPFKANTTYNVSFSGTVDGKAVSKAWSFKTAA